MKVLQPDQVGCITDIQVSYNITHINESDTAIIDIMQGSGDQSRLVLAQKTDVKIYGQ